MIDIFCLKRRWSGIRVSELIAKVKVVVAESFRGKSIGVGISAFNSSIRPINTLCHSYINYYLVGSMGIQGLSKVIGDYAPTAVKENEIKNYFGRYINTCPVHVLIFE